MTPRGLMVHTTDGSLGELQDFSVFMSSRVLHQAEEECGGRVR